MINIMKGTKDMLPQESYKWDKIESEIREVARLFNLKKIATPTFDDAAVPAGAAASARMRREGIGCMGRDDIRFA